MKIGYTGWTWLNDEFNGWAPMSDKPKRDFEQFLKDVSDLGYDVVENFNFIAKYFEDDIDGFNKLTKKYNLDFVNLYHYFSPDFEKDYKEAEEFCEFMKKTGAKYMNLQAVMWDKAPFDRPLNEEAILTYAKNSDKIGKLCYENGITLCLHPHANTHIFKQEEIDLFLANTDPKYVSLCLDTAHVALAGMDPVAAFARYADRLGYVHLKDLDPDQTLHTDWPMKRFKALGHGTVDFKGVYKQLLADKYDGVLCVELDYQPVCNYKSAMISRQYIHDVLGM